jgi:hypothetical protein
VQIISNLPSKIEVSLGGIGESETSTICNMVRSTIGQKVKKKIVDA